MTLSDYAARIKALATLEIGTPSRDNYGQRLFETDSQEACDSLAHASVEIRRTLWSGPYQAEARRLADLADAEAARIASEHGLVQSGRLPRFPGFYSGGQRVPDID